MSWNKSDKSEKCESKSRRTSNKYLILVLSAIAVLALVTVNLFRSQSDEKKSVEPIKKTLGAIREVKNVSSLTNGGVTVESERQRKLQELRGKIYTDTNGVARYPGGLRVQKGAADHKIDISMPSRKKMLFRHLCENEIAALITIQPGELIFGPSLYGPRFIKDFKKSLEEEIKDDEADTPEEREIRRQVREVKKDLAKRMSNGEDIAKVVSDARRELQEAYQYRQNLANELHRIKNDPSFTESDVEDFVKAANEMLDKKGITVRKFRSGFGQTLRLKPQEGTSK